MMTSRGVSLIVSAGLVLAVGGISHFWHGSSPSTLAKPAPPVGAPSAADDDGAGTDALPSSLIIDYRDDVSDAELAATPEIEEPISRFSTLDRVYRVRFATPAAAGAAASRLRASPRVESV